MDHSQQMEALRLEPPEKMGADRFYGVVEKAVENALNATASVDTLNEDHYAIAGAVLVSETERFLQDKAMQPRAESTVGTEEKRVVNETVSQSGEFLQKADILRQAETIVAAEKTRIELGRQSRDTHDQIDQIRADVHAAGPTSFKDNPLFRIDV